MSAPELPISKLEGLLARMREEHRKIVEADNRTRHVRASVDNLEIVHKNSYERRPPDAIAARAIKDVMADAVDRAEQSAHAQYAAACQHLAQVIDDVRADLCNEAARASVALGAFARELRQ